MLAFKRDVSAELAAAERDGVLALRMTLSGQFAWCAVVVAAGSVRRASRA